MGWSQKAKRNTKLKKIVSMSNLTFFKSVLNCAEGSWDLIVEKLGSGFPCNCQPEKQKQFSVIGRRWKLWSGGCLFKTETCSIVGLWKIKTEKQKTEEKTLRYLFKTVVCSKLMKTLMLSWNEEREICHFGVRCSLKSFLISKKNLQATEKLFSFLKKKNWHATGNFSSFF